MGVVRVTARSSDVSRAWSPAADVAEFESLVSALVLSEAEVDDLCDPFVERCVDLQHRGIGRANDGIARAQDSQELFA